VNIRLAQTEGRILTELETVSFFTKMSPSEQLIYPQVCVYSEHCNGRTVSTYLDENVYRQKGRGEHWSVASELHTGDAMPLLKQRAGE
jgi:hypothetical protein